MYILFMILSGLLLLLFFAMNNICRQFNEEIHELNLRIDTLEKQTRDYTVVYTPASHSDQYKGTQSVLPIGN